MAPTGCPETSLTNYQSTLRNIPEEQISHLHPDGSLYCGRCMLKGWQWCWEVR